MADKEVGALLVLDAGKIVGNVAERDYARNGFLKGRASPQTLVGEIMTRDVICVEPDKSIEESMAIMSAKRVRHLPVVSDGELLGIVSTGISLTLRRFMYWRSRSHQLGDRSCSGLPTKWAT